MVLLLGNPLPILCCYLTGQEYLAMKGTQLMKTVYMTTNICNKNVILINCFFFTSALRIECPYQARKNVFDVNLVKIYL